MWGQLIATLVEVFNKIWGPLFGYLYGTKTAKLTQVKDQLEIERKANEVAEKNLAKSDADILNELRSKDTRGES